MSSPLIWIIFPGVVGGLLLVFQRYKRPVYIAGITTALLLAGLAWILPIGESISIGFLTFRITDILTVLGRRFLISSDDKSTLILIYSGLVFWFIGSSPAMVSRLFIPLGLIIAGLLTAALAVETFLYGALIIELIVLVSVPLLTSPGKHPGRGVIRYLVFQTIGFPFILFTGWLLTGIETGVAIHDSLIFASVLMGLGFWFLLGIFPFHSWIPMLSEEAHPYSVAFLLYELILCISLFAIGILDRYVWVQQSMGLYQLLEIAGVLMIFIGGVWAAFQRNLGRLMGYAIIVEIGLSILAIRIGIDPAETNSLFGIFFAILFPRAVSLGVWALAIVTLVKGINNSSNIPITSESLSFKNIQGAARRFPVASACLLLAQFSIAGFPLLVGFPVRLALWSQMAHQSMIIASLTLVGYIGLLFSGLRTMAVLVMGPDDRGWEVHEPVIERALLGVGGITLLIMGIFPQLITPLLSSMANLFFRAGR